MKRSFFQAAVTSILLYGCTTWTLTKRLEKKLDGNYTRMLRAILNKSWRQHPTRHQQYGHLPPITKTIQVRRARNAGHCWRSRDELISDVLSWTLTHGRAKAGRPARTYIQQLCEDTGCCPEDLPRAMNDREEWRERVRDIRATSAIWWWWWWWSIVEAAISGSCTILFKVLAVDVLLLFSNFCFSLSLSSVADFLGTGARAPTSAGRTSFFYHIFRILRRWSIHLRINKTILCGTQLSCLRKELNCIKSLIGF